MNSSITRIACVAGELSGDLLGSLLIRGMQQHIPDLQLEGVAGSNMQALGMSSLFPMETLSVNGFVDVLKHYPSLKRSFNLLHDKWVADPPDLMIGIDAPGFNLRLEKKLKQANIKTVHFVSPSVWAWRAGRVNTISQAADHILCIFPFEPEIYTKVNVAASYVGHPLADMIPMHADKLAARHELSLSENDTVLAILPGSRRAEIELIAPRFFEAAKRLQQLRPNLKMIVPVASERFRQQLSMQIPDGVNIQLFNAKSHTILAASDAVMVASGTATLEAMLFKRPMVIGYVTAWLNYHLVKRMLYLPWVGLPNVLAREFLVPELIQHACTPQALVDAILFQLEDTANREYLLKRFTEFHELLRRDTANAAGEIIANLVAQKT